MFSSSVLEIIKILLKIFFLTTNLFSVYQDEQNSVEEEQSVYLLRKSSSDDFVLFRPAPAECRYKFGF